MDKQNSPVKGRQGNSPVKGPTTDSSVKEQRKKSTSGKEVRPSGSKDIDSISENSGHESPASISDGDNHSVRSWNNYKIPKKVDSKVDNVRRRSNKSKKRPHSHSRSKSRKKAKTSRKSKYDYDSSSSSSSDTDTSFSSYESASSSCSQSCFDPLHEVEKERFHLDKNQEKVVYKYWRKELMSKNDVKKHILDECPKPTSKGLKPLKKNRKITKLINKHVNNYDQQWKVVQEKIGDIMGPLSKLWNLIDMGSHTAELDIEYIKKLLDSTVILAGQSSQMITYYRRYNFLNPLFGYNKTDTKEFIEENKKNFRKDLDTDELIGNKVYKELINSSKAAKEIETLKKLLPKRNRRFQNNPSNANSYQGRGGFRRGNNSNYSNKGNRSTAYGSSNRGRRNSTNTGGQGTNAKQRT
ncbi:unnamed protein product [Owenia fusiformis]|uniref:Uncharacterized protein n=1 Tax=Owenia fusiformis TaxID=6347 RepID=A0A8J1UMA0_OWEFU|nr:unnamed protein product [Owenia fusiformis]